MPYMHLYTVDVGDVATGQCWRSVLRRLFLGAVLYCTEADAGQPAKWTSGLQRREQDGTSAQFQHNVREIYYPYNLVDQAMSTSCSPGQKLTRFPGPASVVPCAPYVRYT